MTNKTPQWIQWVIVIVQAAILAMGIVALMAFFAAIAAN